MNTSIQQGYIMIKINSKDIYKDFSTKILSSTILFNIDNFLSTKSSLEWFLKDHVTLKTGVME